MRVMKIRGHVSDGTVRSLIFILINLKRLPSNLIPGSHSVLAQKFPASALSFRFTYVPESRFRKH